MLRKYSQAYLDEEEATDDDEAFKALTKPDVDADGAAELVLAFDDEEEEDLVDATTGTLADVVAGALTSDRHSVAPGRGSLTVLSKFMFFP